MPKSEIIRKPLLSADIGDRRVRIVEVREITFEPGQVTGRHKHPCPVISYIAEGTAREQQLCRKRVNLCKAYVPVNQFIEPADAVIARFDNASSTERMKFIAHYLLTDNEPLIEMLE